LLGTAISIQALQTPTTAYQLSDLNVNLSASAQDPPLISWLLHGNGNDSWYFALGDAALHIVNLQNPGDASAFQIGLQWHTDTYNPTGSLGGFFMHFVSEVLPGIGVSGEAGILACTVSGGCH
jgi:hypothetical protein